MGKAEIAEKAETAETAEGPAPAPVPAPVPAPATTLEIVHKRPHTPRTARKSTYNFGMPASANSDFYIRTLFQPGSVDTQYNVLTLCEKTCK